MLNYIIRRLLYAIPILLGVNLLTFALFFMVNTPDDMARIHLGAKHVTPESIARWKSEHGYDKPLFFNNGAAGVEKAADTLFVEKSLKLFVLDFGAADDGRDIAREIKTAHVAQPGHRPADLPGGPAGLHQLRPAAGVLPRHALDTAGVVLCVALMSISGLFYVIGGQYLMGKLWHWFPISGYQPGLDAWKFLLMPVLVSLVGGHRRFQSRFYRALFIEEIGKDYVRTARAKGLSELRVLFRTCWATP
jgi:peptide/nickel transport system permease protein